MINLVLISNELETNMGNPQEFLTLLKNAYDQYIKNLSSSKYGTERIVVARFEKNIQKITRSAVERVEPLLASHVATAVTWNSGHANISVYYNNPAQDWLRKANAGSSYQQ